MSVQSNTVIVSSYLQSCVTLIDEQNFDRLAVVVDGLIDFIESNTNDISNSSDILRILRYVYDQIVFLNSREDRVVKPGRPRIDISAEIIMDLVQTGFKLSTISKMLGISRWTLSRRLQEIGSSISAKYTTMTDEELGEMINGILVEFPNSGYRRIQGYLRSKSVFVQYSRLRFIVKTIDPQGVFQRTMRSRIIVRRKYYVKHSNDVWHLDTHMKLIRWKIIVRGCLDGKSRLCTYLEADNNNRSDNNLNAFLKGVSQWSLPSRTRSDKGKENVLIARYMLENRGCRRGSHICGRSVMNQRIERFWGDVFQGMLWAHYVTFSHMETEGILDVNNILHMTIFHRVFLPRLNMQLQTFMDGWNSHPLSTEHNYSPKQLFLMHMRPESVDDFDERNLNGLNTFCNEIADLDMMNERNDIVNPVVDNLQLSELQEQALATINICRESSYFGVDVFQEACNAVYSILVSN